MACHKWQTPAKPKTGRLLPPVRFPSRVCADGLPRLDALYRPPHQGLQHGLLGLRGEVLPSSVVEFPLVHGPSMNTGQRLSVGRLSTWRTRWPAGLTFRDEIGELISQHRAARTRRPGKAPFGVARSRIATLDPATAPRRSVLQGRSAGSSQG